MYASCTIVFAVLLNHLPFDSWLGLVADGRRPDKGYKTEEERTKKVLWMKTNTNGVRHSRIYVSRYLRWRQCCWRWSPSTTIATRNTHTSACLFGSRTRNARVRTKKALLKNVGKIFDFVLLSICMMQCIMRCMYMMLTNISKYSYRIVCHLNALHAKYPHHICFLYISYNIYYHLPCSKRSPGALAKCVLFH